MRAESSKPKTMIYEKNLWEKKDDMTPKGLILMTEAIKTYLDFHIIRVLLSGDFHTLPHRTEVL